jgi:RNA polymerase sigma-70 factor, ECF subfamily
MITLAVCTIGMTPKQEAARHAAFTLAHQDFEDGLNKHAYFKLSNHAIGEDLVQDTFIKTWQYLARGGKIDVMKAFLYHVLNNLIIDEYRKKKTNSLDTMLEKGFEPNTGSSAHLLDELDGKAALLLIARLPAAYQKIMRMRYVQELTLKEMSLVTGQSENALAVQAHRGLAKLKLLYQFS